MYFSLSLMVFFVTRDANTIEIMTQYRDVLGQCVTLQCGLFGAS